MECSVKRLERITPHLKIGEEQQAHNQNEFRRNHSDYDSALDGERCHVIP
jgi:hypothetical protein